MTSLYNFVKAVYEGDDLDGVFLSEKLENALQSCAGQ